MPSSKGPHFVRVTPDPQLPRDLEGSGSLNSLTFSSPIPLSTWTPIPPLLIYPYLLILFCLHCVQAFFSCGKQGVLYLQYMGFPLWGLLLLQSAGSRVHRLQELRLEGSRARAQYSCGTQAWLFRGMWNLSGPGIKPVLLALAGGFLTTGPAGKSLGMYPLFSQRTGIK